MLHLDLDVVASQRPQINLLANEALLGSGSDPGFNH